MSESRGRNLLTLMLVLGAVVFGMILAGGVDLVPGSRAEAQAAATTDAVSVTLPNSGLTSFADLADAVSPAVAFIEVEIIDRRRQSDPLDFFFRRRRNPRGEQQEDEGQRRESSGSGFVISPDGLVVTNFHVIERATGVRVTINGTVYDAEVKGTDPATDLALLKVEPDHPLPFLELGDSEALRVGDWIMVIGSPLRLAGSVSVGVVSAKGRNINITRDASLENFIQTDAAINFGNSGGPLVDTRGRVVGIATAINYGAENIGFAVPVTTLETILPQLRDTGTVKRGYLGVTIATVDALSARSFGLDRARGVYAQSVVEGGPAAKAGLRHGDVILKVDNREISDTRSLIDYVSSLPPDKKVVLLIYRDGKEIKKTITLGERTLGGTSPVEDVVDDETSEQEIEWLGLQYQDLTPSVRENHRLPDALTGVWVSAIASASPLNEENVAPGDVISEVNGTKIGDVSTFERVVVGVPSGSLLRLYIRRFDPRTGAQAVAFFAFVEVP